MFCAQCGAFLPEGAKFCYKCGWQVMQAKEDASNSSIASQVDELTASVENAPDKASENSGFSFDELSSLEQQAEILLQKIRETGRVFKSANKKLKVKHPLYALLSISFFLGPICVILSIILGVITGSYYCLLLFVIGIFLSVVITHMEDKVFCSIASPELIALKKEQNSLIHQRAELLKKIKAKSS